MNKKWRETETKKTTETFESAKRLLLKTFGDAENAVRDGSRDTPSALRHMIEENARTRDKMTCPMGRNPTPLELKSNLVGFLAGVGNSARLVAVVIEMFSRHKQMQERFLVELHQVFGECSQEEAQERAIRGEGVNIDRFDYDRLMRLEYLKCFIHECLRMYPPSVSVAPRSCSSDNPLGKYTIPSGTSCVRVCLRFNPTILTPTNKNQKYTHRYDGDVQHLRFTSSSKILGKTRSIRSHAIFSLERENSTQTRNARILSFWIWWTQLHR